MVFIIMRDEVKDKEKPNLLFAIITDFRCDLYTPIINCYSNNFKCTKESDVKGSNRSFD